MFMALSQNKKQPQIQQIILFPQAYKVEYLD
jgi:hypothetical protein